MRRAMAFPYGAGAGPEISGTIVAEITGLATTTLGPGGFAVMPGGMAHQLTCQDTACLMFVTFDGAYDIFWGKGGRN